MTTIPRRIPLRLLGQQLLAGSLCHDYHHVTISFDALPGRPDDAIDAECNLCDQPEADLGIRQGGDAGDVAGIAALELLWIDSGQLAARLDICRARRLPGRLH